MPFTYSKRPHLRKHGPTGYIDYATYKPWLRDDFFFRCVYCLERERWDRNGHAGFGVDHVKPKGKPEFASLICNYENLVYACNRCNSLKRDEVLLDPCAAALADHVRVADDGSIAGLTPEGKDLVRHLALDDGVAENTRERCLRVLRLYQSHPDDPDIRALYLDYFGYPDDLPNLARLKPKTNSPSAGLAEAFFRLRAEGRLSETYF
jgi:hypothetical protein